MTPFPAGWGCPDPPAAGPVQEPMVSSPVTWESTRSRAQCCHPRSSRAGGGTRPPSSIPGSRALALSNAGGQAANHGAGVGRERGRRGCFHGTPRAAPSPTPSPGTPPSGLTCPSPRGARVLPAAPVATCRSLTSFQTGGGVRTPAQLCAHPPEGAGTPNGCPAWVLFPLPRGRHPPSPRLSVPIHKTATQMIFRDPPGAHILSLIFKKNEMKVKGEASQG